MKLLSLWEPWATLMAIGAKRIETRSWYTPYRGWLAIHASKGGLSKQDLAETMADPAFALALSGETLQHGKIVALVYLHGCYTTNFLASEGSLAEQERAFGDYAPSRFGWVTKNLFRIPEPIPYRAHQGLCELDPSVLVKIREQWHSAKAAGAK